MFSRYRQFMTIASLLLATGELSAQEDLWQQQQGQNQQGQQGEDQQAVREYRDNPDQAREADQLRSESAQGVRRFHEVLDELLAEFGYDVKLGQIKGLKNVAVRKVRVSKAIPRTYENYVEMLVSERIRENSRVRLISCVPCKTRTSSLVDGRLLVTSPATNLARLETAATTLGIENFMDVVLVYHTTHMVLAFNVFNVATKETVWARTYNSETIKSRYQKLAIDYSQVAKSRPGEDYQPEYRFLFGLGGAGIPNVGGDSADGTMINLQVRATEKFNNRRDEFGMMLSFLKTTSSIIKSHPADEDVVTENADETNTDDTETVSTSAEPAAFEQAFALYGIYGHLFTGAVESYDRMRHGIHTGLGLLMAPPGYLAPKVRVGWDIYFGRRFATSIALNYVMPSQIVVEEETIETKGGAGADIILSLNY